MAGESASEIARRHREKIARLEQSAQRWEKGAAGEVATADALAALPAGWTVLHDVPWPGRPKANIDHVAIGPSGVFVIDSKNWTGPITVRDDVLRQRGYRREPTVASAAEAALAVARLTTAVTVTQVHAVLCFTGDEPLGSRARGVTITSTSNLVATLTSRPVALHPTRVAQVVADLDSRLRRPVASTAPRSVRRPAPGRPASSTTGSAAPSSSPEPGASPRGSARGRRGGALPRRAAPAADRPDGTRGRRDRRLPTALTSR